MGIRSACKDALRDRARQLKVEKVLDAHDDV
jgi:hypothetical protein